MIRSELIARIAAQNPQLSAREAEAVVTVILDRMVEAMAAGDRVEIRGFGSFETQEMSARTKRNPRTGAAVEVAPSARVLFKASRVMHARLNPPPADAEQEAA